MKYIFVLTLFLISLSSFSFTPQTFAEKKKSAKISFSAPAQELFGYFRTHRQGSGISVNWSINSPAGIAGFTVERSYDGEFFDILNQVPCAGSLKYTWKDESFFSGYIYYRIGCVLYDGTIHYSPINVVRIVQHG